MCDKCNTMNLMINVNVVSGTDVRGFMLVCANYVLDVNNKIVSINYFVKYINVKYIIYRKYIE